MLLALESPTRFCSLFVDDFPKQRMDCRPLPVETVSFTDRCAHRQIQSLAHLQCTHRGNKDQARKGRRDNICLQKPPVQLGKRKHPSAPVQRTNREDVFAQHSKPVHRKTGAPGNTVSPQRRVETVTSLSLPLYRCNQKLPTRFRTVFLRVDFPSRWTRHDIVSRRMRFSAQRQLMSYFTRKSFARCMQR